MASYSAWEPGLSWWSGLQKNSLSRASSSSTFYAAAAYPFGTAKTSHVSFAEIVHDAMRYNAKGGVLEVVAAYPDLEWMDFAEGIDRAWVPRFSSWTPARQCVAPSDENTLEIIALKRPPSCPYISCR